MEGRIGLFDTGVSRCYRNHQTHRMRAIWESDTVKRKFAARAPSGRSMRCLLLSGSAALVVSGPAMASAIGAAHDDALARSLALSEADLPITGQTGTAQPGARQNPPPEETDLDTPVPIIQETTDIIVSGVRETQRNSLQTKRNANLIVDALVSDEIGATPDQSVGETLERIVGVTADRFKGSASEISIRGLGPFLGFSTLNGREVTSGSGDRAVSFQQFPSELVNGVLVYKSQNASLVEGGTSGIVDLRTLRPLDYGKSRLTVDARAVYEPYDAKIIGRNGLGYRVSASYVGQTAVGDGELGISIGYARADEAAAEDFYTESSTTNICNTRTGSGNCTYSPTSGNPFYFAQNSYLFRQMNNSLTRDAVMGTLQYKPRPELDINIDGQFSRRSWLEDRSDIVIAEGRRGITPTADGLSGDGALIAFSGNSRLESQTRIRSRDEDYYGGGASVEWTDDAAKVGIDVSYSETRRLQVDRSTRLRTSSTSGFSSGRVPYSVDKSSGAPVWTFDPAFDITDHDNFDDAGYARRDQEDRRDKIFAVRLDGEAFIDSGFITSLQAGLRYSDHHRVADLANQNRIESVSNALEAQANQNCRIDFREKNYFSDSSSNVDNWAQFDGLCVFNTFAGSDDIGPLADGRSNDDIDVTERIMAGYVMANFANAQGTLRGNVGVRVLNTDVDALGYVTGFDVRTVNGAVILTPNNQISTFRLNNSFTNILPSLNVTYEVTPTVLTRAAVYRSLSRPNIEDQSAGRSLNTDGVGAATIQDAITGASGGNPRLEPLTAWNADLSFEWYPTPDNAVTLALFYKQLQAGIVPAAAFSNRENFNIGGQNVPVDVAQQTNSNDKNDLYGLELTVNHSFSYLPGLLSGFGVIAGYSYADSNFEYPDPATDGKFAVRDFTDPANIIGLSHHTLSAEGYYEKGPVSLRLIYKYRSEYLKPFQLAANRFAIDQQQLDASASFSLTDNIQLRFQALNLTNTADVLARPVADAVSEISRSGRRYYAGVKVRF